MDAAEDFSKKQPQAGRYNYLDLESVFFGQKIDQVLPKIIDELKAERVFFVSSNSLSVKTDVVKKAIASIGNKFIGLFDKCVQHVPRDSVLNLAKEVRKLQPDLIVTFGGGTPIDTVKILQICLANNIQTDDELGEYRIRIDKDGKRHIPDAGETPIRQIVIPTTLSGAEFSNLGGCSDPVRKVKDLYTGAKIGPKVVIYDPSITVHTPDWLWYSTGIRAIDHAVETVCSRKPQIYTDANCLYGLKLLSDSLRKTIMDPDDLVARSDSQIGVWLASSGLGRVEWGASHGIGHQLGAVANVPHGYTSCVMLHNVLRFNYSANKKQQEKIAEVLGGGGRAADLIENLIASLGMPVRLKDVGVNESHFDAIAKGALQNMMVRSNPRPINHEDDVLEILRAAL